MLSHVTQKHKYKTRLLSDDDPAQNGCIVDDYESFGGVHRLLSPMAAFSGLSMS